MSIRIDDRSMKTMIEKPAAISLEQSREMICWIRKILTGETSFLEKLTSDDWVRFMDFSKKQGIAPVLYHAIKDSPPATIPEQSLQQLKQIYFASAHRNTLLYHESGKVLKALHESSIPVIVLKGACLAEVIYGNIALRSMGDVDILVKRGDMTKVVRIMSELGYSAGYDFQVEDEIDCSHHLPPLIGPGKLSVEVHWNIIDSDNAAVMEKIDIAKMWERARPVVIAKTPVFMLSPEDMLLHLCLHLTLHHLFDMRLRAFLDLKKVVEYYGEAVDWELLRERSRTLGVDSAVRLSLCLAEQWVGLTLPERLRHDWKLKQIDSDLLSCIEAAVLGEIRPYTVTASLNGMIVDTGFSAKVRILWQRLFISPTVLSRKFNTEANSWKIYLYYPVRWLRLTTKYSPALWRAFRGNDAVITHAQREHALRKWLSET